MKAQLFFILVSLVLSFNVSAQECLEINSEVSVCSEDSVNLFIIWDSVMQSTESIELYIGGNFKGVYSEMVIGPFTFEGNGQNVHILIRDHADTTCATDLAVELPDCSQECVIEGLVAGTGACENGQFVLELDFETNSSQEHFDLYINEELYNSYTVEHLPLHITVPDQGTGDLILKVCMNDQPDCCETIVIDHPDCSTTECLVFETEVSVCHNDSVEVFVIWNSSQADSVNLYLNGTLKGTYLHSPIPITVEGNGENLHILLRDPNDFECAWDESIHLPNCNDECVIEGLVAGTGACENGQFVLELDFETNSSQEHFDLYINEEFYSSYAIEHLPLHINVPDQNTDHLFIEVCMNDQPECCAHINILHPECSGCNIFDMTAEEVNCTDSTFYVEIDFSAENTFDQVLLFYMDQPVDIFNLQEFPVVIGPFDIHEDVVHHFLVRDIVHCDCAAESAIHAPDCTTGVHEPAWSNFYRTWSNGTDLVLLMEEELRSDLSSVHVFNVQGRKIYSLETSQLLNSHSFSLESGVYFISLYHKSGETSTSKVLHIRK